MLSYFLVSNYLSLIGSSNVAVVVAVCLGQTNYSKPNPVLLVKASAISSSFNGLSVLY